MSLQRVAVSYLADDDSLEVVTEDGTATKVGGGGSQPGVSIVRAFPFTHSTPNLHTGAALYTPTIGDILMDAWIEINTAWDGTTPLGEVGMFDGALNGLFSACSGAYVDMTAADDYEAGPGNGLLIGEAFSDAVMMNASGTVFDQWQVPAIPADGADQQSLVRKVGGFGVRVVPLKMTAATPIKVCVSQTGLTNGGDPGSTQGAAILYLVTATPATS